MTALLSHLFDGLLRPLLEMSITAAFVAVVVFLLRLVLKKRAPRQVICLMWLLVFARLLLPVALETPFSLVPDLDELAEQPAQSQPVEDAPQQELPTAPVLTDPVQTAPVQTDPVQTNPGQTYPVQNDPVQTNPIPNDPVTPPVSEAEPDPQPSQTVTEEPAAPAVSPVKYILPILWAVGVVAMAGYAVVSYLGLRRRVFDAIRTENGVWEHPDLRSPFILGVIKPGIYLPMGLDGHTRGFILLHERAHLRRLDHVVKPLCWVALAIHWYNPFAWMAFLLMSRDMEAACDDRVLEQLGMEVKADYSAALLELATNRRFPAPSPLSFGEGDAKFRIKNVLNFKKPALWVTIVAIVVAVAAAVTLLTDPAKRLDLDKYARLIGYPGIYGETTIHPEYGTAVDSVYEVEDGELVFVAGRIIAPEKEFGRNTVIIIHPDGTESGPVSFSEGYYLFEQHVVHSYSDQEKAELEPGLLLLETPEFQLYRSPFHNLYFRMPGTTEGGQLRQVREPFFNREDVTTQLRDMDGDGTDEVVILSKTEWPLAADADGYGDILLICRWSGKSWSVASTEEDMEPQLNMDGAAIPLDVRIDANSSLSERLSLLENCTIPSAPKILSRSDGSYKLVYTAYNDGGAAVAEITASLVYEDGQFTIRGDTIFALSQPLEPDPDPTVDPNWTLMAGVEGFGQVYAINNGGINTNLVAVSGDYQWKWLAEEFYSAGMMDPDGDGVEEMVIHSAVGAGGGYYDILTVLEPDGDSWTERTLHGLGVTTYTGDLTNVGVARFTLDGDQLTLRLLDNTCRLQVGSSILTAEGAHYAENGHYYVETDSRGVDIILAEDNTPYYCLNLSVRKSVEGSNTVYDDPLVDTLEFYIRADYKDGVFALTPVGFELRSYPLTAISEYFDLREQMLSGRTEDRLLTTVSQRMKADAAAWADSYLSLWERNSLFPASVQISCSVRDLAFGADGKTATAAVYEWVWVGYNGTGRDDPATDEMGFGVDHKLTLTKGDGGEWVVTADGYEDGPYGYASEDFVYEPEGTLLASLDSHDLRIYELTTGEYVLAWGKRQRTVLNTYISDNSMRGVIEFYPADRNNDGQDEVVILYWKGGGTGVDEWGLMAAWMENGEIQVAYHDWQPMAEQFEQNNRFTYDAETGLGKVTYNGRTVYASFPEGDPTETAPGHTLGEGLVIPGDIVRYVSVNGGWRLSLLPSVDNGQLWQFVSAAEAAWNIEFDGREFRTGAGYLLSPDVALFYVDEVLWLTSDGHTAPLPQHLNNPHVQLLSGEEALALTGHDLVIMGCNQFEGKPIMERYYVMEWAEGNQWVTLLPEGLGEEAWLLGMTADGQTRLYCDPGVGYALYTGGQLYPLGFFGGDDLISITPWADGAFLVESDLYAGGGPQRKLSVLTPTADGWAAAELDGSNIVHRLSGDRVLISGYFANYLEYDPANGSLYLASPRFLGEEFVGEGSAQLEGDKITVSFTRQDDPNAGTVVGAQITFEVDLSRNTAMAIRSVPYNGSSIELSAERMVEIGTKLAEVMEAAEAWYQQQ